ncbi:hypothetical protein AB1Y20_023178 [Prymnesium parvum]|uniref:ATP synthase mitochondrial F1 complex assembly factor 2 n=1 Tax=Prymnesium parvum TaxID=97485 RepID=A0AB34JFZ6_PRYPA
MKKGIKRLYDKVSVTRRAPSEFAVLLDGRPLKTPAKKPLVLPTEELAFGIAVEWDMQGKMIRPDTMSLMKLATTAIDQVPDIRPTMVDSMMRCLGSDLACFRTVDEPQLMAKEEECFSPLLEWLHDELKIGLATSETLTLRHPPFSLARVETLLASKNDWEISALDFCTSASKSFVISLALCHDVIDAEKAAAAARVAERFQIEEWGEVEAGHDLDAANALVRISAASTFFHMLRQ